MQQLISKPLPRPEAVAAKIPSETISITPKGGVSTKTESPAHVQDNATTLSAEIRAPSLSKNLLSNMARVALMLRGTEAISDSIVVDNTWRRDQKRVHLYGGEANEQRAVLEHSRLTPKTLERLSAIIERSEVIGVTPSAPALRVLMHCFAAVLKSRGTPLPLEEYRELKALARSYKGEHFEHSHAGLTISMKPYSPNRYEEARYAIDRKLVNGAPPTQWCQVSIQNTKAAADLARRGFEPLKLVEWSPVLLGVSSAIAQVGVAAGYALAGTAMPAIVPQLGSYLMISSMALLVVKAAFLHPYCDRLMRRWASA